MSVSLTRAQKNVLAFLQERSAQGNAPPTYREICDYFGYRSPKAASDHVAALERKGMLTRERGCARGLRLIVPAFGVPLLGRIPAGMPREALLGEEQCIDLDPRMYGIRDSSKAFAVSVVGDSMIERHICEGDIVILERDAVPTSGDVVAALVDNEVTLKTFVLKNGRVWLRAENPNFCPALLPFMDLRIQGVARGIIRVLR